MQCIGHHLQKIFNQQCPSTGLGGVFHDDVARYLVAMGGHEGVVEALKLSGLSPALETQLAILVEDWDRAAAAFQAMALGIKDRNLLQLVRDVGGQLLDSHASHAVESKGERDRGRARVCRGCRPPGHPAIGVW